MISEIIESVEELREVKEKNPKYRGLSELFKMMNRLVDG